LHFVHDEDDYVRRIALMALSDIGSPRVEELVVREWETGDEHQRMGVLYALAKIGSPKLKHYLALAEADGRPYITQYIAVIRAGNLTNG
jgi:HEAT repeat protein